MGHGRAELADAAAEQMRKVAFTNNYTGFSNVPAIELAAKVADLAYEDMTGVFFTNSGSESNEGTLKVARFYWNLKGRPSKVKLIARERSYHGGTLATSAMTGLPASGSISARCRPRLCTPSSRRTSNANASRTPTASAPTGWRRRSSARAQRPSPPSSRSR